MCWPLSHQLSHQLRRVSVAGCLGYDVLVLVLTILLIRLLVSVAGCLGYDVLDENLQPSLDVPVFQLLVV